MAFIHKKMSMAARPYQDTGGILRRESTNYSGPAAQRKRERGQRPGRRPSGGGRSMRTVSTAASRGVTPPAFPSRRVPGAYQRAGGGNRGLGTRPFWAPGWRNPVAGRTEDPLP